MPEPEADRRDVDEAQEALCGLVIAGSDTTGILELVETQLDHTNDMGGTLVRTVGMVRARAKIGMKNLTYNIRRLVQFRRINPCPA